MKKILIAYYTHSGNTEKIAEEIKEQTGGELLKIEPEKEYPKAYTLVVAQAKLEIMRNFTPKLKAEIPSLENYDVIFVGTPNWWSTMAPPVKTFLTENNLKGKIVIPFYTHGGGGAGHIVKDMKNICSEAEFLKEFEAYGNGGSSLKENTAKWIENLKINRKKDIM